MTIIIEKLNLGKITWQIPDDLSNIINDPEKKIENALKESRLTEHLAVQISADLKRAVINTVERQVRNFFELLTLAHRQAVTANPPSKYSKLIDTGITEMAKKMKSS